MPDTNETSADTGSTQDAVPCVSESSEMPAVVEAAEPVPPEAAEAVRVVLHRRASAAWPVPAPAGRCVPQAI